MFPNLRERFASRGTHLSGGEQQMLAIGRILRTGAQLLLLDEPTEGLAPIIVQHIGSTLRTLKEQGFTILLVEQNFRFASTVADRYYVVEHGRVIDTISNDELAAEMPNVQAHRGVDAQHEPKEAKEMQGKRGLSQVIGAVVVFKWSAAAQVSMSDNVIKIGVLNDRSLYADLSGQARSSPHKWRSRTSARRRREMKVEIVSADHQNKPDVGSNIARQWLDVDKVDIIVDVPNSG